MSRQLIYILAFFILTSCGSEPNKPSSDKCVHSKNTSNSAPVDTAEQVQAIDYSDSINFTDSNGWKQGQWIKEWKGRLVENYFYVNDSLHGHYETDHGEGQYKNGQKDGLQFGYYGKKESILMVNLYDNGEHIWGGFPAAGRSLVIPAKGFHVSVDSTFVKAPYINGKTWYEGSFTLRPDDMNNGRLMPYGYGIHKVYHMSGALKGIIDYDKKTVQEFETNGKQKYHAEFEEFEIHQQPIIGRYLD